MPGCLRDGDVDVPTQRRRDGGRVGQDGGSSSRVGGEETLSERRGRVDNDLTFRCTVYASERISRQHVRKTGRAFRIYGARSTFRPGSQMRSASRLTLP